MGFFLRALYFLKDASGAIWYGLVFLALLWFLATPHDVFLGDWIINGSGFGLGALLFVRGFSKLRESRLIENTPLEAIRGIPMGSVHVRGKATGGEPLTSLFTRTPCFYYWAMIERYQRKGKTDSWFPIKNEAESRWFYLDDGTGKVWVNPHGAEYDVVKTLSVEFELLRVRKSYVDPSLGIPAPTEELFKYVNGDDSPLRFTEFCLIAGREHNILGTCTQNPEPRDEHDRNLISKGEKESIFQITSKKEQELEKAWKGKALLQVVGGAAFMIMTTATTLGGLGYFRTPPADWPERLTISSGDMVSAPELSVVDLPKPIFAPLPKYPPLVRQNHDVGAEYLKAMIDREGAVKNVREDIVTKDRRSNPLLVASAIEAVSRWRYDPILFKGKPVEVEIWFDIDFEYKMPQ